MRLTYHTTIYEVDNECEPTVQRSELHPILCNDLYGKNLKKVDICITDPLCYTPKTTTTW